MGTRRRRSARQGMMLAELLAAMLVIALAGVGIVASYLSIHGLMTDGREQQVAMDDLRDMMERIHATPFGVLTVTFPAGTADYAAVVGPYLLGNQQITVAYPVSDADRAEVQVTVSWDHGLRSRSLSLSTLRSSS